MKAMKRSDLWTIAIAAAVGAFVARALEIFVFPKVFRR